MKEQVMKTKYEISEKEDKKQSFFCLPLVFCLLSFVSLFSSTTLPFLFSLSSICHITRDTFMRLSTSVGVMMTRANH